MLAKADSLSLTFCANWQFWLKNNQYFEWNNILLSASGLLLTLMPQNKQGPTNSQASAKPGSHCGSTLIDKPQ